VKDYGKRTKNFKFREKGELEKMYLFSECFVLLTFSRTQISPRQLTHSGVGVCARVRVCACVSGGSIIMGLK